MVQTFLCVKVHNSDENWGQYFLDHYGKNKPALTVSGEETEKTALISSEVETKWVKFRNLLTKKP